MKLDSLIYCVAIEGSFALKWTAGPDFVVVITAQIFANVGIIASQICA